MDTGRTVVIGTRGSELALWQSRWVEQMLRRSWPDLRIETHVIKTTGDRIIDTPLSAIGDKGLFTKEIEKALLDKKIDLAVHSLKDLPTVLPPGLALAAVTSREDPRDVFIAHPSKMYKHLREVPANGIIATGSLRRRSQMLNHRPDLDVTDLRGNLSTRLKKLEESEWDGIILARAGVLRLGKEERITEVIPTDVMLPAVGQGAMGVEIRGNDDRIRNLVHVVNDQIAQRCTEAERALLRKLEGGCQIPIGAYGRIENGNLVLDAVVGTLDGSELIKGREEGDMSDSVQMGVRLAERLLRDGADRILEDIRRNTR